MGPDGIALGQGSIEVKLLALHLQPMQAALERARPFCCLWGGGQGLEVMDGGPLCPGLLPPAGKPHTHSPAPSPRTTGCSSPTPWACPHSQ